MQRILLPALLLAALLAGGCTKDDATESAGAPVQPASNDPTAFEVQFAGGAFPPPVAATASQSAVASHWRRVLRSPSIQSGKRSSRRGQLTV